MKRKSFILAILALFSVASCQEPEPETPDTPTNGPQLVSSTPEDGATGITGSSVELVLTFDMNVMCPSSEQSRITVDNGAVIDKINAYMKDVTLEISGLGQGKTYTVTLPEGTVTGYSDNPADAISISFSTWAPEPPVIDGSKISSTLVTADAIPNATRVYQYLLSVYGEKTVSSAIADVAWNNDEAEWVGKWTGNYPAIATYDYIHLAWSPANWIDYSDISPVKSWFERGGITGACWHWNVPRSQSDLGNYGNYTCTTSETVFRPTDALTEGTWQNDFLIESLDKISEYILLLQAQNIPLIWRPLHEAAGNTYTQWHSGAWFWWGADGGETYVRLWRYVFDYFKSKGIKNLIWVWTTQTSNSSDIDSDFYPGDDYVDIIGKDIYNNSDAVDLASQYSTCFNLWPNKMLALSELGNVAEMGTQWDSGARWLFFMPWYDANNDGTQNYAHGHADIAWWKKTFESEAVISLDELPADLYE